MSTNTNVQELHSAGANAIGFDYQFYYFMYLALSLKHGEKIGFEVKEDVHIDKSDGSSILFQGKHSVQTNKSGEVVNLTTLDVDLWKTVANWTDFIHAENDVAGYLSKTSFVLFTNKNEDINGFLTALSAYKASGDLNLFINSLKQIKSSSTNGEIIGYLKKTLKLGKKNIGKFFSKVSIETSFDDIINKIKNRLLETTRVTAIMEAIFEKLYTALQGAKYLDIKDEKKFEITFADFNNRFGRCFEIAFQDRPLPVRSIPFLIPEDLEEQMFIKQLIDVGEVTSGSKLITKYTEQMLKTFNHFTWWTGENLIFPHELKACEDNALLVWESEFISKYRDINGKITQGISIDELELEIKKAAVQIVDSLRKEDLDILNVKLGREFSIGQFYMLSDRLQLGWHLKWEDKYKQ